MLIKVSRSEIKKKIFDITETELREELSGDKLEEVLKLLPTEDEKQWMKIYQSNAPELARIQRKISVCLDAEIDEMEENRISFTYDKIKYEISAPINSFSVLKALDNSISDALFEMSRQGCIKKDGSLLKELNKEPVDSLSLISRITDKFFFQIYM